MRYCAGMRFETTPMDYLILAGVVIAAVFGQGQFQIQGVSLVIVKAVLLLYASEIIIERASLRWGLLNLAGLAALGVFTYKGLLAG